MSLPLSELLKGSANADDTAFRIATFAASVLARELAYIGIVEDGMRTGLPGEFIQSSTQTFPLPAGADMEEKLVSKIQDMAQQIRSRAVPESLLWMVAPELPSGVHMRANGRHGGFLLRFLAAFDIFTDTFQARLDALYTFVPKPQEKAA